MKNNFRSTLLAGCTLAMLPVFPATATPGHVPAHGAQAPDDAFSVNVPAQSLSGALRALSRQTGLEIVFTPALVEGRRSPGINGHMTARAALDRLLAGSGLSARFDDGAAVLVRAAPVATAAPATRTTTLAPAQEIATPAQESVAEEIVVQGSFADSIASALDRKRQSDNVMDSIEAIDIAQFPNQNLAEALQRVPGVTIERDRGEGLFVNVRGLGSNFQVTLLNGQSIAVNENVRDSGQSGRQFRFDTIPSELVSGVDVIKSPSADLEEGAIGGIVNIRTFKPLDLDSGTLVFTAAGSYAQLADTVDPNFSGLASWHNESGTFGALIAASYSQRTTRQDRITGMGWEMRDGVDTNGDSIADTGEIMAITAVRPTLEQEDRERYAVNAAVQFAPSERVNLLLEGFYTRLNDHYDELTYSADIDADTLVPGTAVIRDGALVGGTANASTQISRDISDMVHQNWFIGLSGDVALGAWTFHPTAYVTRALSNTAGPITRTRLLGPIGQVAFSIPRANGENIPSLDLLDADLNDPSLLPFRRIEWRPLRSVDKEHAFGLSVERPVAFGPVSEIEFGAKYRSRNRDYQRRDLRFTTLAGQYFDGTYFNSFPFDDFLSNANGSLPTSWLQPIPDPFWNESDTSAIESGTLKRDDLRNSYQIGEEITSAYAMGRINTHLGAMSLRGNFGVRYAHTRQNSSGYADDGTQALPVSFISDYDDFLPSANLVLEPMPNLLVRVSAARVITRPSLADLAPRLTLNSSGTVYEASGGNPELKRFQAWQYDAGVEYYFAPGSAVIASVFYKDISTFVYNQTSDFVVDGQTYALTAPTNGGDAWVRGLELAFQHRFSFLPAPFDGLGVQVNYTLTDSQASYSPTLKDDLAGIARHSYNLTGFYTYGPFEAWLSYSWRGDVLQSVGTNDRLSINQKAFGSLDGSISLRVTDHATVSLQGINILGATQMEFVGDNWFGGYTDYGTTYRLSARIGF